MGDNRGPRAVRKPLTSADLLARRTSADRALCVRECPYRSCSSLAVIGVDRRRALRKARRHRIIRVIVVCLSTAFLVLAAVHLRTHWSVPGAWAVVLVVGVAAMAALIVLGVVVGRRRLRS